MKTLLFLLLAAIVAGCVTIRNEDKLMSVKNIGQTSSQLKLNGYYFHAVTVIKAPYHRNGYGGYSEDTTKKQEQIRVIPLVLYADGSTHVYGSFSGLQENSSFNYRVKCNLEELNTLQNACEHFECYFTAMGNEKVYFYNKKAEILDQGIFRIQNNEIVIQYYYVSMDAYQLAEERGRVLNDSTFVITKIIDHETGKEQATNEVYQFKRWDQLPKMDSYILKNPKKFK
ncbi:hypothetical protein ACFQ3S_10540 [Mucilaginibacter terrae]|uniref:hypothetical protein n=1 Tax=Mucilaginibacter terrae TaxID=1955052 RepID=UPI003640507A